jgi:hypothetical protein
MHMTAFFTKFPDLAAEETRGIFVWGQKDLPDGQYGFVEFYCAEKGCDCRRVVLTVTEATKPEKILATINYGWGSVKDYEKWLGDKKFAAEVQGAALEPWGQQTRYARALLKLFTEVVLKDPAYIARLKRHYKMFKQA